MGKWQECTFRKSKVCAMSVIYPKRYNADSELEAWIDLFFSGGADYDVYSARKPSKKSD